MRIKPSIKIAIVLAVLIHLAIFWGFKVLSPKKESAQSNKESKQEVLLKVEKKPEPEEFQIPPKPQENAEKPDSEIRLKPITIYSSVKPNLSEEIKKDQKY